MKFLNSPESFSEGFRLKILLLLNDLRRSSCRQGGHVPYFFELVGTTYVCFHHYRHLVAHKMCTQTCCVTLKVEEKGSHKANSCL